MTQEPAVKTKRLKRILFFASIGCLLIYLVGRLTIPAPSRYAFVIGRTLTPGGPRADLYDLGSTNVGIVDGNLYNIRSISAMSDADIAVSVKLTAGEPFHPESAHSQLIKKLELLAHGDKNKVQSLFDSAYNHHPENEPWVEEFPSEWTVDGGRVFLFAAMQALQPGKHLEVDQYQDRERRIREVVNKGCETAKSSSSQHLAIPLIGAGAAGVPEHRVVPALLAGLNNAASENRCPPKVTFVTFSEGQRKKNEQQAPEQVIGSVSSNQTPTAEQSAWLADISQYFMDSLKPDSSSWEYHRNWLAISQFFLIAIAPMAAGILALNVPSMANRLRWGPVAINVAKWAAIVTGMNGYAQFASGEFTPQPLRVLIVAMVFAFVSPLVEWFGLSKVPDAPNEPEASQAENPKDSNVVPQS